MDEEEGAHVIRVLLLADTHLGFDLPVRPRVERRRRGHDFFANYGRTLKAAVEHEVDFIVHGGDLFFRSRIPANLVQRAFLPLKRVADAGIPVYVVPGNHERSSIPYSMLALHEGIHIFDRPRTFETEVRGSKIALSGFPFVRGPIRGSFGETLGRTGWMETTADLRLLCSHQSFEGAKVGPVGYTFRHGDDVVQLRDVPDQFAAVLAGHIHRHQVLEHDLQGRAAPAPVLYPGSIERTSFAEKSEAKGYMVLVFRPDRVTGGSISEWDFCRLPARPMVTKDIHVDSTSAVDLRSIVRAAVDDAPTDAVLRIRVHVGSDRDTDLGLSAANLRALTPPTMNVEFRVVEGG